MCEPTGLTLLGLPSAPHTVSRLPVQTQPRGDITGYYVAARPITHKIVTSTPVGPLASSSKPSSTPQSRLISSPSSPTNPTRSKIPARQQAPTPENTVAQQPQSPSSTLPTETSRSTQTSSLLKPPSTPSRRRVFGITLSPRKATLDSTESSRQKSHRPMPSSESIRSNEALISRRSHDSHAVHPMPPVTMGGTEHRLRSDIPAPTTSTRPKDAPANGVPLKSKGNPSKIDFWRSPLLFSHGQEDQSASTRTHDEQPRLRPRVTTQIGTVAVSRPVPILQHIPPTPVRSPKKERQPRVESFMSDSIPLPLPLHVSHLAPPTSDPTVRARQPHPIQPTTPTAPLQRSKSNPSQSRRDLASARAGRISPCLRIPSPKLFSREPLPGTKITPPRVSSPRLRDKEPAGGKSVAAPGKSARRATHGSFDFERPGSRTSSKSGGGTESRSDVGEAGCRERDRGAPGLARSYSVQARAGKRSEPLPSPKNGLHALLPVPPLPTPRLARRPAGPSPQPAHVSRDYRSDDDTALPRLASSLARCESSRTRRTHVAHPPFAFEPAAPPPPRALGDGRVNGVGYVSGIGSTGCRAGRSVDLGLGFAWAPTRLKDNAILETGTHVRELVHATPGTSDGNDHLKGMGIGESGVAKAFKDALSDDGFNTFRKYVRRFDARIIPLDGPSGLIVRVQNLLDAFAPSLDKRSKQELLASFINVVRQTR